MIPDTLHDWTFNVIADLVNKGMVESEKHDFKADIPHAEALSNSCCAFANSLGGFIILGVSQADGRFKIEGINVDLEIAKKFGEKMRLSPTVHFDSPLNIAIPGSPKVLTIFHIPRSPTCPHCTTLNNMPRFYKRTNKGNDLMSFEEIRDHFLDYEQRREKIKMLYIELSSNLNALGLLEESNKESDSSAFIPLTLTGNVLDSLLVDLYSTIGRNRNLIKTLLDIRLEINQLGNESKIFFSRMSLPMSNMVEIISAHKIYTDGKIKILKPLLDKALSILTTEFGLTDPLA